MTLMWRKQLEIGDETIDIDHKYLICLINTVELTMRTPEHRELLPATLEQLVEYTYEHFKREELIMLRLNYPRYPQHKQQHQLLIKELANIQHKIQAKEEAPVTVASTPINAADSQQENHVEGGANINEVNTPINPADSQQAIQVTGETRIGEVSTLVKSADSQQKDKVKGDGEFSNAECADLATLFRHWLLDHLIKEDMLLKPYLTGKN